MEVFLPLIIFCCLIDAVLCGSYCYDSGRTFYCEYGCCGSDFDEYCCGVYSWIIAVAVIGGIIFIAFIVCLVCVFKKKQMAKGRVVNHAPQTEVHTTSFVHAPPPGYLHQPPPYQQPQGYAPTPQGYAPPSQGVYPPPPPANYAADSAYPPQVSH